MCTNARAFVLITGNNVPIFLNFELSWSSYIELDGG